VRQAPVEQDVVKTNKRMKIKLLLITIAIAGSSLSVKAQTDVPNYMVAGELMMIVQKIGLPVDSAVVYLKDYTKVENTQPSETVYKSNLYEIYISFEKSETGQITLIKCFMASSLLSTAQKAIVMMGMIASHTEAPPGYTAFATPKYAAFLNPEIKPGYLSLVMVQGGK
jgi:hypothetical protein